MSLWRKTGPTELIDLALSFIALTAAFAILWPGTIPSIEILLISGLGAGSGFILHEMAHKVVAQRYGYWAEYRANRPWLVAIIFMAMMGFIFALPGAVMIRKSTPVGTASGWYGDEGRDERSDLLRIAIAGPLTNIVFAIVFFAILVSLPRSSWLALSAAYSALMINLTLAAFNLLPFGPLDGRKIYQGNPLIWLAVGVPTILAGIAAIMGARPI